MLATTTTPRRSTSQETSEEDLVLRFSGSSRDGQIVRLRSPKCTVGSGPQCTLRLRARGVAPLHCLILRGQNGTVVRRWSADTRLNHRAFTDAHLSSGDQLSLGPIELEVLSTGTTPVQSPEAESHRDLAQETNSQGEIEKQNIEKERHRLRELAASLQQREDALATQSIQETARLAELEAQRESHEAERRQWQKEREETRRSIGQQQEQLAAGQADIEKERNLLAEQQTALETERNTLTQQQAALEAEQNAAAEQRHQQEIQRDEKVSEQATQLEQMHARLAELEAQRESHEAERRQWQEEREETRRSIDQQQEQLIAGQADIEKERNLLADRQATLETEQNTLTQQQAALETERNTLTQQQTALEAEQNATEAEKNAVRAEREALEEEQRLWKLQQSASLPLDEPATETPDTSETPESFPTQEAPSEESSGHKPVDLAEVFRRVGARVDLSEEEPEHELASTPTVRSPDATDETSAEPSNASAMKEGEEESIDDYMARLIQRTRSANDRSKSPAHASPNSRQASTKPATTVQKSDLTDTPQPSVSIPAAQRREPTPIPPRAAAPENRVDLSALRELANLSARSAISRHSRHILVGTMYSKLLVAAVALFAGAGLLWMWSAFGARQMTFYAALVALLVAIYWGVEYALLTGRFVISKSGHIDWNPLPRDNTSSLHTGESDCESPDQGNDPSLSDPSPSDLNPRDDAKASDVETP